MPNFRGGPCESCTKKSCLPTEKSLTSLLPLVIGTHANFKCLPLKWIVTKCNKNKTCLLHTQFAPKFGGAKNDGHEIAGHENARQGTSSEAVNVWGWIDWVVCYDSRNAEDQSRVGLIQRAWAALPAAATGTTSTSATTPAAAALTS